MTEGINIEQVWPAIAPETVVVVTALVLLAFDLATSRTRRWALPWLTLAGIVVAFGANFYLLGKNSTVFSGMFVVDTLAVFLKTIFLGVALLTVLISLRHVEIHQIGLGEYYELILFCTMGMMVMASATDLVTIYLGLEVMAISLYVLAGFLKTDLKSNEASLKYFLLGIFASAILVYGMSLLYGITGTTNLSGIATQLAVAGELGNPVRLALVLLTAGVAFKIAAVPFHMWAPDAYEGAPTPITAMMSVGPKAAGFAVILRLFAGALPVLRADWVFLFTFLSVLSMTVGNVVAIAQQNVKRLLAYSSIAHAGYLLIGVVAAGAAGPDAENPLAAILVYLFAYMFMNIGAFAMVIYLESETSRGDLLSDFAGLARTRPGAAVCMTILLLSLIGIPPTLGFVGKLYIFAAAIEANLYLLAVVGVLNSVVAAFYYVRIIVYMFMHEPEEKALPAYTGPLTFAIVCTVILTLAFGLFPGVIIELARSAAPSILM